MYRLFSRAKELKEFVREEARRFKRELGIGGEGVSYLGYNGKVYKFFYQPINEKLLVER